MKYDKPNNRADRERDRAGMVHSVQLGTLISGLLLIALHYTAK